MANLVMVAKYPAEGKCKTRLAAGIGAQPAATFARAALCDLLERLSTVPLLGRRVLLYAPLDQREAFADLLRGLGADVATAWALQPMEGVGSAGNLAGQGTDLGSFLAHALDTCGHEAPVVFIGTDCATLPCDVIVNAARDAAQGAAHICPAADGGYVALALPAACPHSVFDNVLWSHPTTCASQRAAIARVGLSCIEGPTLQDVDEESDYATLKDELTASPQLRLLCPRVAALLVDPAHSEPTL